MICKVFLLRGVCDINMSFFLIYLLSIIILMLHYLVFKVQSKEYEFFCQFPDMVEMRRIELLTPCLQGRCSPS